MNSKIQSHHSLNAIKFVFKNYHLNVKSTFIKCLKIFKRLGFLTFSFSLFCAFGQAENMPYADDDFQCTSKVEAEKYIKDYGIDVKSFGGLELCNGSVDLKKLLNDLSIVEKGEFSNSGSNILIRNFLSNQAYYGWMKGQTRSMERGNDIPWATAYNSFGNFTMQDGWSKLSTLGRVGTVIHEARHTAGYRHIRCLRGPYGGAAVDGCDSNYGYGGSHGVEMEYYARVSVQGSNFHPVYKTMARLMAIARTNFVFNDSPIRQREGILVLDANKTPILIDQTKDYVRESGSKDGKLKRTSYGALLLNGIKSLSIEIYENSGFNVPIDDTYSYFKLIDQPNSPVLTNLVDFEEIDLNDRRYAVAINNSNEIRSYRFANGSWTNPSRFSSKIIGLSPFEPSGRKGIYAISENMDVFQVDPVNMSIRSLGQKWPNELSRVATIGEKTFRLKSDGKVYISERGQESILPRDASFTDLVSVPLYDAFEVK